MIGVRTTAIMGCPILRAFAKGGKANPNRPRSTIYSTEGFCSRRNTMSEGARPEPLQPTLLVAISFLRLSTKLDRDRRSADAWSIFRQKATK
jgi:hypothetical protein